MKNNISDVMNMLTNQHMYAIKKYAFEMVKDRYPEHEELITRLCSALITEKDIEGFAKLMADLYESGFLRALEENKAALKQAGYELSITPPPEAPQKEIKRIFPVD